VRRARVGVPARVARARSIDARGVDVGFERARVRARIRARFKPVKRASTSFYKMDKATRDRAWANSAHAICVRVSRVRVFSSRARRGARRRRAAAARVDGSTARARAARGEVARADARRGRERGARAEEERAFD